MELERAALGLALMQQRTPPAGEPCPPAAPAIACQVCSILLEEAYCKRYKVCRPHMTADEVMHGGVLQRFCQQCARFHPVTLFAGAQRSCREQLARHAERRRMGRHTRRRPGAGKQQRDSQTDSGSPSVSGGPSSSSKRARGQVSAGDGAAGGLQGPFSLLPQPKQQRLTSMTEELHQLAAKELAGSGSAELASLQSSGTVQAPGGLAWPQLVGAGSAESTPSICQPFLSGRKPASEACTGPMAGLAMQQLAQQSGQQQELQALWQQMAAQQPQASQPSSVYLALGLEQARQAQLQLACQAQRSQQQLWQQLFAVAARQPAQQQPYQPLRPAVLRPLPPTAHAVPHVKLAEHRLAMRCLQALLQALPPRPVHGVQRSTPPQLRLHQSV